MLRAESSNHDDGREPSGQDSNPVVPVEPADHRCAEYQRDRKAQAHRDVQPKQGVALRGRDLRALHRRMTQAEILEDQRQPVERRDHRQKAEIGRGQQPGQNDHRAELNDDFGDLRQAREKRSLNRALSEAIDGSVVDRVTHRAPVSGSAVR